MQAGGCLVFPAFYASRFCTLPEALEQHIAQFYSLAGSATVDPVHDVLAVLDSISCRIKCAALLQATLKPCMALALQAVIHHPNAVACQGLAGTVLSALYNCAVTGDGLIGDMITHRMIVVTSGAQCASASQNVCCPYAHAMPGSLGLPACHAHAGQPRVARMPCPCRAASGPSRVARCH
jgi:hypothetical protein